MARADLHVHTRYSCNASDWFLQRLGAAEPYTSPEQVREHADRRGMHFFTVTDHNSFEASAELAEKYPGRFFACSTAY